MRTRLSLSIAIALLVGSIVALADTTTTNFGWDKPTVNASSNTWGTSVDANYDSLDATLGAVLSATGNKLTPTQLISTGNNVSAAAWTTSGIRDVWKAATFTDTTSSGTVATVYADAKLAATIAASSATTYTNAYGAYFVAPAAGTNVTLTNAWALGADSLKVNGNLQFASGQPLNDYEEGTFTPTLVGAVTAGSPTYTSQSGFYRKVGTEVTVWFDIAISAVGGMVGNLEIGGLPFAEAPVNARASGAGAPSLVTGLTHTSGYTQWGIIGSAGGSVAIVIESGSGQTEIAQLCSNVAATAEVAGSFTYHTT